MPRLSDIRKQALDEIMKKALFEATISVLSQHGVEGLTMERVAAGVGIAKGSLYRYFKSKKELIEFVYAKMVDPLSEKIDAICTSNQPALKKLQDHLSAVLEHVAEYIQVHRLLFDDETAHSLLQSSERRTVEIAKQHLAAIFQQGIEEGVFRPADPFLLAHMFLGLCKGVFQSHPALENAELREKLRHTILDIFLNGIATEKGCL